MSRCGGENKKAHDLEPLIYYCYYKNGDLREHLNTFLSFQPSNGTKPLLDLQKKLATKNPHTGLLYLTEVLYQIGGLVFAYNGLMNINANGINCWSGGRM